MRGLDELRQSVRIVLETPLRSVPGKPEFGSDLFALLDKPITVARPRAIREARRALEQWEPRIEVLAVDAVSDGSRLRVQVTWRPKEGSGVPEVITI